MARSRADVGSLLAQAYDTLDEDFEGYEIHDAVLVLEVSTPESKLPDDSSELVSDVIFKSTTSRVTVNAGIIAVAADMVLGQPEPDEDDD